MILTITVGDSHPSTTKTYLNSFLFIYLFSFSKPICRSVFRELTSSKPRESQAKGLRLITQQTNDLDYELEAQMHPPRHVSARKKKKYNWLNFNHLFSWVEFSGSRWKSFQHPVLPISIFWNSIWRNRETLNRKQCKTMKPTIYWFHEPKSSSSSSWLQN